MLKKIACTTAGLLVALAAAAAAPASAADTDSTPASVQQTEASSGVLLSARAWDW